MLYLQSKYLTNTDSDRQILHKCVWNLTIKDPPTSSPHRYGPFNTLQVPLYLWEPHNVIQTQKPHKWYWSCMSVCSQTPPRPFDRCTSFWVKRCFSYPEYTLSIFRDLDLNVKVTMADKVTKFSTKNINFGLYTRVIAQNDRLAELNNYYIKTYGLKWIVFT